MIYGTVFGKYQSELSIGRAETVSDSDKSLPDIKICWEESEPTDYYSRTLSLSKPVIKVNHCGNNRIMSWTHSLEKHWIHERMINGAEP